MNYKHNYNTIKMTLLSIVKRSCRKMKDEEDGNEKIERISIANRESFSLINCIFFLYGEM